MTSLWRYCRDQYDRVMRIAGTMLAERLMWLFAVLESIIIPIPVDPLLVATVLARPAAWIRLTAGCTIASVIGGGLGWALGASLVSGASALCVATRSRPATVPLASTVCQPLLPTTVLVHGLDSSKETW